MSTLKEVEEQLAKQKDKNRELQKTIRDYKKEITALKEENTELETHNMHLSKKIILLKDREENNMQLTTKINEVMKISIDEKLKQLNNNGNTSR